MMEQKEIVSVTEAFKRLTDFVKSSELGHLVLERTYNKVGAMQPASLEPTTCPDLGGYMRLYIPVTKVWKTITKEHEFGGVVKETYEINPRMVLQIIQQFSRGEGNASTWLSWSICLEDESQDPEYYRWVAAEMPELIDLVERVLALRETFEVDTNVRSDWEWYFKIQKERARVPKFTDEDFDQAVTDYINGEWEYEDNEEAVQKGLRKYLKKKGAKKAQLKSFEDVLYQLYRDKDELRGSPDQWVAESFTAGMKELNALLTDVLGEDPDIQV